MGSVVKGPHMDTEETNAPDEDWVILLHKSSRRWVAGCIPWGEGEGRVQ